MKIHTLLLLSLAPAIASCGSSEEPSSTSNADANSNTAEASAPVDLAAGAEFYANTCTPCHGANGQGDGAISASLVPSPRDLTDSVWQASVDDTYLRKIIQYGGAAVDKQPTMPANPVLGSQKDVMDGLIAHIRGMAK